jgi:PTH1 family peptidyl-tRNA hydrolase
MSMKLIAGLGNPGAEYTGTRHNAGFMVVNRLAERHAAGPPRSKFSASVLETRIGPQKVLLMQPLTYMNRSGQAVGPAVAFHKLAMADVMIVVDDTALPLGAIRIRRSGGAGSHNGLIDIERALGTEAYPRLRIGVGEPRVGEHRIAQKDYVLSRFTEDQRDGLARVLDHAADALECWLTDGIDATMNRYNHTPGAPGAPDEDENQDQAT